MNHTNGITYPYPSNGSVVASSTGRSNVSTEPVAGSEDDDELDAQTSAGKAEVKPFEKVSRRRRAQGRHSKKQQAQFAALQHTHETAWATAILLSACNVAYDMLRARGWEDDDATAFARRMAEKTGEKLGETLAGVTA